MPLGWVTGLDRAEGVSPPHRTTEWGAQALAVPLLTLWSPESTPAEGPTPPHTGAGISEKRRLGRPGGSREQTRRSLAGAKGNCGCQRGLSLLSLKRKEDTDWVAQMESRPQGWWAPPGCPHPSGPHMAPGFLALFLLPWTQQLAGGQTVTHTGPPILASLTHSDVSFECRITYKYIPELQKFTVSYFLVDLQGKERPKVPVVCQQKEGTPNQTHSVDCKITPQLLSASATGTYYCFVHWSKVNKTGNGTFILVRDTGYQAPPPGSQKVLLFCFLSILVFLSILGTVALLWKKRQMGSLRKPHAQKGPATRSAHCPEQSPVDSVYTALQRRETEVYSCIQSEPDSPQCSRGLLPQEKLQTPEDDSEFNLVYENL